MSRDDSGDVTLQCKIVPEELTFDRDVPLDCAAFAEVAKQIAFLLIGSSLFAYTSCTIYHKWTSFVLIQ
jgi:hypothetical protein